MMIFASTAKMLKAALNEKERHHTITIQPTTLWAFNIPNNSFCFSGPQWRPQAAAAVASIDAADAAAGGGVTVPPTNAAVARRALRVLNGPSNAKPAAAANIAAAKKPHNLHNNNVNKLHNSNVNLHNKNVHSSNVHSSNVPNGNTNHANKNNIVHNDNKPRRKATARPKATKSGDSTKKANQVTVRPTTSAPPLPPLQLRDPALRPIKTYDAFWDPVWSGCTTEHSTHAFSLSP
jgi:hypothetical protein